MSKLEELINTLCPNGVEYKAVGDVCKICRGVVLSKDFIRDNMGTYPVYSSQTENNGEFGRISTYNFDGEYLTWTTDGANAGSVFYRNGKFSVTNVCGVLEMKDDNVSAKFLFYVLQTSVKSYVNKGMGNPKLMSNVMARIKIPVPPIEVQREIVRILDNFTTLTAELTAELTARKKQFEYYRNALLLDLSNPNIERKKLCDLLKYIQPTQYIVKNTNYSHNNLTPVLTAGQSFILGYTNELDNIYNASTANPVIIFDDFTTSIQWVDFNFKVKSSAMKFLTPKKNVNLRYIYYAMKCIKYDTVDHARQWISKYSQIEIPYPPLKEQERIVAILDRFDKLCNDISQGLPAEIEARKKQYEYYRDKLLTFKELS